MQAIAKPESKEGHIYFKDNLTTPNQQILSVQKTAFGLTNNDQAELIDTWTYKDGSQHYKYIQKYL